jgi:dTDP-4-dehydrorhamnose 3,5-epimerase
VIFEALPISGAFAVAIEPHIDERGFFARLWCRDEFAAHGIRVDLVQASVSHNRRAGTLRGLHFSHAPSSEGKLVRCERGRAYDVMVDLRPDSAAYLTHVAVELDAERHNAVWIPPGVAHGFQTLVDDTDIVYGMSDAYRPELADGVRFDDPAFGLRWPLPVSAIAERDRTYPDFAGRPAQRR